MFKNTYFQSFFLCSACLQGATNRNLRRITTFPRAHSNGEILISARRRCSAAPETDIPPRHPLLRLATAKARALGTHLSSQQAIKRRAPTASSRHGTSNQETPEPSIIRQAPLHQARMPRTQPTPSQPGRQPPATIGTNMKTERSLKAAMKIPRIFTTRSKTMSGITSTDHVRLQRRLEESTDAYVDTKARGTRGIYASSIP